VVTRGARSYWLAIHSNQANLIVGGLHVHTALPPPEDTANALIPGGPQHPDQKQQELNPYTVVRGCPVWSASKMLFTFSNQQNSTRFTLQAVPKPQCTALWLRISYKTVLLRRCCSTQQATHRHPAWVSQIETPNVLACSLLGQQQRPTYCQPSTVR
jgi:hypothetical protein